MRDIDALSLEFAAGTDIGCRRSNNEDSFGFDVLQMIYVVCDGMGGMAAGEVASSMAVRSLVESFEQQAQLSPVPSVETRLFQAICDANDAVRSAADADHRLHGMGTTLVCACLDGRRVLIGNVGDSRAYFVRGGGCAQITQDHSLVGEQLRNGSITEAEAAASASQSIILRAIGAAETVEPDLFAAEVAVGDMLLLCSDGLPRYLPEDEIAAVLRGNDLPAMCQQLIDRAKHAGGADNITCLLLRVLQAS